MAIEKACVIGGGFYGTTIALFLKQVKRIPTVILYEQESELLGRASYVNQARVHNGYHYPRSFTTAYRSHTNFARFCKDWSRGIHSRFDKYYAIARRNSKVTSAQFIRFCEQIGAPIETAGREIHQLFNPTLIEKVFKVEEHAFNANALRSWMITELQQANIQVALNHRVSNAHPGEGGDIAFDLRDGEGRKTSDTCNLLFNCTYSGLGQVHKEESGSHGIDLKHEVAELSLIEVPRDLAGLGVTVMDGPFFSVMPFPARGVHSLSHVRYTPHCHWQDRQGLSPYEVLRQHPQESRVDRMLRDASRYMPTLAGSRHVESLYEVKTVLCKNEVDDGRPILFRENPEIRGMYSILGGKLDNIYDILERIENLPALQG
jgi:hypothetical protein